VFLRSAEKWGPLPEDLLKNPARGRSSQRLLRIRRLGLGVSPIPLCHFEVDRDRLPVAFVAAASDDAAVRVDDARTTIVSERSARRAGLGVNRCV
jgi:hypothetical protein